MPKSVQNGFSLAPAIVMVAIMGLGATLWPVMEGLLALMDEGVTTKTACFAVAKIVVGGLAGAGGLAVINQLNQSPSVATR